MDYMKNTIKNKSFYFHLTISSICCLLFFYFLLIYLNKYTLNSKEFELKSFTSFNVSEAISEIENLGLNYEIIDSIYTDSVPKGTVFSQDPLSGTYVKNGRKIYLTINRLSDPKYSIPDVFNKSEREATMNLQEFFNVESYKTSTFNKVSSVVTKLTVNNLEVFPGQEVIKGSTITLHFESGRSDIQIIVPNIIGNTLLMADEVLHTNNLKLGEIVADGLITDTFNSFVSFQRPLSNSKLQEGDMVDVIISQHMSVPVGNDTISIQ